MPLTEKNLRIVQEDGQVFYVSSAGKAVPLSSLVHRCGYRIEAICEALAVSPRHLRRMFTDGLALSPKKWLRSERMVHARNLLKGGYSIKETSEKLGFNSQKDFYLEFKEYYAVPPSDYLARENKRLRERLEA